MSQVSLYLCLLAIVLGSASAGKVKVYNFRDQDRIVNGQNATIDQIPYIVQVIDKYAFGSSGFLCGGTLISERHVVSAAHCFKVYNTEDLAIIANATYLVGDEGAIQRDVVAMTKHPKYDEDTDDFDVAVLTLSEPLPLGEGVKIAKMCSKNWKGKEKITVSGWGHTVEKGASHSNQLQYAKLTTMSRKDCAEEFDGISEKMICSVVSNGKDACQGDSGGPAFYNGELCGIVSFGFGCGREGVPGVFASVAKLGKFITRAMAKDN